MPRATSTDPLETAELLAFTRIVEARSLSRAAQQLKIPRATLGRRLARLEARLGTRLVRRTTRTLAITDAGEVLFHRARAALEAVAEAEASVREGEASVRGELRISAPPITVPELAEVLLGFAREHPEVRCHYDFSTRHVDLQRDGYDVAIRATGAELEPGLVARTIARGRMVAVASPAYLAAHGVPRSAKDLHAHRCLMGFARGEHAQTAWPRPGGGVVRLEGAFFANDLRVLAHGAVTGMGIALLPEVVVRELVSRGELVPVLPDLIGGDMRIAIVYAERELMPPQLRAFIDWVAARLPPVVTRPLACPVDAPGVGRTRTRPRPPRSATTETTTARPKAKAPRAATRS
ncbi:MAG: LysR family transcriptional regulator [Sandaracinaceae bacterium]|nr:LysR family transcriptional regulator [Sandaracinaceae bacterium]